MTCYHQIPFRRSGDEEILLKLCDDRPETTFTGSVMDSIFSRTGYSDYAAEVEGEVILWPMPGDSGFYLPVTVADYPGMD